MYSKELCWGARGTTCPERLQDQNEAFRCLDEKSKGYRKAGNDIDKMPIIAQHAPVSFPKNVLGTTSPYPTVAIVIIDHQIPSGIDFIFLVFSFSSDSSKSI